MHSSQPFLVGLVEYGWPQVVELEKPIYVDQGYFDASEKPNEIPYGSVEESYIAGKGEIRTERKMALQNLGPSVDSICKRSTGSYGRCKEVRASLQQSRPKLQVGHRAQQMDHFPIEARFQSQRLH